MAKREQKGGTFKCVVFVQQRLAAVILSHYINSDPELQSLGLRSGFVTARNSRITPSIKVNKTMAANTIQAFRDGTVDVLVATSVIEEVRRDLVLVYLLTP